MNHKTYKGRIGKLQSHCIFVFGSNPEGRHGRGAALDAVKNHGAIYGQGYGRQGRSYAIVTKDLRVKVHPSVSVEHIEAQINELYEYAAEYDELEFYIIYDATSPNLNAYTNEEMAKMFACATIPENIVFEEGFYELVKSMV